MADYPSTAFSPTTKNAGDTIQPAHVNNLQAEVTALEQALLTGGVAHHVFPSTNNARDLGTTALRFRDVYVANALQGPMSVNGAFTLNAGLVVAGNHIATGILSPAQITANQNDYNPAGLSTSRILRLATDASRNITGLTALNNGQWMMIRNGGAFNIVLVHESASSSAANRFSCPGAGDFTLNTCDCVELFYDGAISRWAVCGF